MWSGSFMFLSYQSSISKYSIFFPNRILYEIDRYLKVYAINHSIPYCLQNLISVMAPSVGHFADTAEFFSIYIVTVVRSFFERSKKVSLYFIRKEGHPPKRTFVAKKNFWLLFVSLVFVVVGSFQTWGLRHESSIW